MDRASKIFGVLSLYKKTRFPRTDSPPENRKLPIFFVKKQKEPSFVETDKRGFFNGTPCGNRTHD